MTRDEMLNWLRERDERRLAVLWRRADETRARHVGHAVFLRALIEISNHCVRSCHYCGLRAENRAAPRYRMSECETMACVRQAQRLGLGTVVLQAGEDPGLTRTGIAALVRAIKRETAMAVTLSLGERSDAELAEWRAAGADRYLLRFETSNAALFARIHPPRTGRARDRIAILRTLRELGYELGSGVMIGIPGQTIEDLADDIGQFRALELDMIGVGPFIPHVQTPLGCDSAGMGRAAEQVANDELTTYKVIALTRLICPSANIPSTTALASLNPVRGRELALQRGANIIMPNFTPLRYRALYDVYPGKACVHEEAETCLSCLRTRIERLGRCVGVGRGDSPHYALAATAASALPERSSP